MTSIHYCVTKLLRKKYTFKIRKPDRGAQWSDNEGKVGVSISFKSRVRGSISNRYYLKEVIWQSPWERAHQAQKSQIQGQ